MAYVSFGKSSNKATALGNSANVDKVYFPTDDNSIIMGKKIYGKSTWFGTCSTPATTAAKVVDCENFVLTLGCIIGVKFTYSSNASNCTLNVNNTGAKLVWYNNAVNTSNSNSIYGHANRTIYYMYDGTYWVWLALGWLNGNAYTSPHCTTVATTAAKFAGCSNYTIKDPSYVHVLMGVENTAASALTLNINGLGAKPIYINGLPSSATNYTLPRGTYLVRYENGIYWFNTNDIAPIKVSKDNVKYETVTVSDTFTNRVTANGLHFSGKLAHIDKIKGNTIVWNLLVLNGNFSDGSGWNRGSGFASISASNNILTAVNNPENLYNNSIQRSANITLGHKYYVSFWFCGSIEKSIYVQFANDKTAAAFTIDSRTPVQCNAVVTADYKSYFLLKLADGAHTSEDWFKFKNIVLMDLTLMFGKGNEPTKEEFEALFPNPYYTYETGRLCSFNDNIKENGFNLWDASLNENLACHNCTLKRKGNSLSITVTGSDPWVGTSSLAGTDLNTWKTLLENGYYGQLIPVDPNCKYHIEISNPNISKNYVTHVDKDLNVINFYGLGGTSVDITPLAHTRYFIFRFGNGTVTSGTYDFEVNLSVSDPLSNGTYKPYWTGTNSIAIKSLTSNGEVIFPEGLLSAGEVYDEIVGNKAIKRVGMVDLGSFNWSYYNNRYFITTNTKTIAPNMKTGLGVLNYVTEKYVAGSLSNNKEMKSDNSDHFEIADSSYSDASAFKTSLQGLILYYELTTPIEYTIDLNINYYFKAEALGYELLSKIDRPIPASSPASMDITYGINEEEYNNDLIYNTINTNNGGTVYVEKYSKTNLYTALTTALNSNDAYCEFDCTYFTGTATFPYTINIDKPCSIKFGNITITTEGLNFFNITSSNVLIIGYNRLSDRTNTTVPNATVLVMGLNSVCNDSNKGYHIYSKGNKNLRFEYLTLKGIRTTLGRQCGNSSYPIDGCGGIYIEKLNPLASISGNTCNNIIINLLLIDGSKAHGIYLGLPILSTITNTRLSLIAGHGIFINEGTSLDIDNVYVSSASLAGFCISGVSYCTLTNCVAEYAGIGFLTRASFNVSIFSPGCEELTYLGTNPWASAYAVTSKYGFNIQTSGYTLNSNTGNYSVAGTTIISDVNDELYNAFAGTPFVISGGRGISLFTPYATGIAANYKAGLTSLYDLRRSCLCRVIGNARKVFLNNISGAKKSDEATKWEDIYNDIRVESTSGGSPDGVEIVYDVTNPLITHEHNVYVTPYDATYAPVYIVPSAENVVVRNGGTFYTPTVFNGGMTSLGETNFLDTILAPLIRVGNVILDGTDDSVKIVTTELQSTTTAYTIESGSIGLNSGDNSSNSSYARTADLIPWTNGMSFNVSIPNKPEGYNVRLFRYNSDLSYNTYSDLGRVAPSDFNTINSYMQAGEYFRLRFETSHPEYITFSTTTTLSTEVTKAKLNLDSQKNPVVNGIILKDTEYYHIKDDEDIYPISHPDVSTQPSLLPLKFGSYKMYEVASRVDYSMTDNVGKANILNFHLINNMPYADINSPYSYSGVDMHLSLDRPSTKPLEYDLKCVNSNSSGNKFKKIQNVYYLADRKILYFDTFTNNGDLEYMLLYEVDSYDAVDHSNDVPELVIIDNFLIFSFSTNGGIIKLVSFVPLLDVPSKAVVTSAVAISESKCEPIKVIKYNSLWCVGLPLDFRPDYVLCLYYIEGNNYYYSNNGDSSYTLNSNTVVALKILKKSDGKYNTEDVNTVEVILGPRIPESGSSWMDMIVHAYVSVLNSHGGTLSISQDNVSECLILKYNNEKVLNLYWNDIKSVYPETIDRSLNTTGGTAALAFADAFQDDIIEIGFYN